MIRSESGAELLNAHELSVPFKMINFVVDNIGGGFVVVNHYGDYIVSATRIDVGILGIDWADIDSALLYLHRTADLTSTKCNTTGIKKIGGAGALLYFTSKDVANETNRQILLSAFISEIQKFNKSNILVLPASLTGKDLVHMYKANEALQISKTSSHSNEEKKAEGDGSEEFVPIGNKGRKGSFALASESFEYPIPKALITEDALRDNIAAKSAAHSAFGSIVTLTKAKQWTNSRIVLLGVTPLSCELYHLLTRETDTIFLSDPDSTKFESSKIPPRAFVTWSKARAAENNWDIVVFCSPACPTLDEKVISSIRCKALISVSDNVLPIDQEKRAQALMQLEKQNIFEVADGMSDLGEIAKMYSLSEGSSLSFNDAFELGCQVMQKTLHVHGIITSDDVTAKRKFHDLMLHAIEKDENARLFGLGTVMHQVRMLGSEIT
jgi:hypothetical protein